MISIPDKPYKLLTLIGCVIISFSFIMNQKELDKTMEFLWEQRVKDDSLDVELLNLLSESSSNNKIYILKLKNQDTVLTSRFLLSDEINSLAYYHKYIGYSLSDHANAQKELSRKIESLSDLISNRTAIFGVSSNVLLENFKASFAGGILLIVFGFILFIVGLFWWIIDSGNLDMSLIHLNERIYKRCQSCGFCFDSMIRYGSNADMSENKAFCSKCYSNGKFNDLSLDMEKAQLNYLNTLYTNPSKTSLRRTGRIFYGLDRWKYSEKFSKGYLAFMARIPFLINRKI